jgi:hypothetical protein
MKKVHSLLLFASLLNTKRKTNLMKRDKLLYYLIVIILVHCVDLMYSLLYRRDILCICAYKTSLIIFIL